VQGGNGTQNTIIVVGDTINETINVTRQKIHEYFLHVDGFIIIYFIY